MISHGAWGRVAAAGIAAASAALFLTGSSAAAQPSTPHAASSHRPTHGSSGKPSIVAGRYIVILKDSRTAPSAVRTAAANLSAYAGAKVGKVYTAALKGFSAQMTAAQAQRMATRAEVARVEPVRVITRAGTQTAPPSWGLDRIDQVGPKLDSSYTTAGDGAGVTAYVIDSGISIAHEDFGGRASYGFDATDTDPATPPSDCDGHGTHVAGTIGGTKYGVAKAVNLVAVKVFTCDPVTGQPLDSTNETVIAAVDWVTANAVKPAVANMSLGGVFDPSSPSDVALEQAVQTSIASGITYTVAAGNDWDDSCKVSPARVPEAITVGAVDRLDYRAWFSNIGACVDIFAPGVMITSAGITSTTATAVMSGTSMATPHVAGAAALLLAANPTWTPQQVRDQLLLNAIQGGVHDNERASNRLLHIGAAPVARSGISLRTYSNGKFVTAESGGAKPLIGNRLYVGGTWEKLAVVDAGGGFVALKSSANGKYVTAESAGAQPLIANRTTVGAWEKFKIVQNLSDGTVSFIANANGKYVTAPPNSSLIANRTAIGLWEKFDITAPNPTISITANANGKLVTSPPSGTIPLTASRTVVGLWERFTLVDIGGSDIALQANSNNRFVTAESGGAKPLIANRGAVGGSWEVFWYDYLSPTGFQLTADANKKTVTAENAGAKPLIANRTAAGAWETFFLSVL